MKFKIGQKVTKSIIFDSKPGFKGIKQSGNVITTHDLESYWVDKNTVDKSFQLFTNIDSIKLEDRSQALTYSSFFIVYHSNTSFNVYFNKKNIN